MNNRPRYKRTRAQQFALAQQAMYLIRRGYTQREAAKDLTVPLRELQKYLEKHQVAVAISERLSVSDAARGAMRNTVQRVLSILAGDETEDAGM